MTDAVLFQKRSPKGVSDRSVGEILLNRPDDLNAMNLDLIMGLQKAVRECHDPEVRAVVLKGKGRCFCAGGDIKAFKRFIDEGKTISPDMPNELHVMVEELRALEKPVLASIHGAAAGAGTPLALACDLVIASEDSIFNLAYARIGLSPDGSSTYFLPRHVGMKKATELFMMIPTLKAPEAKELGLINWVVPVAELEERTESILLQLASGPTKAYGRLKKLLNASFHNSLHDQLSLETQMICDSSKTEDFKEGIRSFLEKRPARYQGK